MATKESIERQTMRMGRNFFLALRSHGVPETAARFVTRGVIEQYSQHVGKARLARAKELTSAARAKELADQLLAKGFQ